MQVLLWLWYRWIYTINFQFYWLFLCFLMPIGKAWWSSSSGLNWSNHDELKWRGVYTNCLIVVEIKTVVISWLKHSYLTIKTIKRCQYSLKFYQSPKCLKTHTLTRFFWIHHFNPCQSGLYLLAESEGVVLFSWTFLHPVCHKVHLHRINFHFVRSGLLL